MNNVNKNVYLPVIFCPLIFEEHRYIEDTYHEKKEEAHPAKRRYCLPVYTVSERCDTVEKLVTFEWKFIQCHCTDGFLLH